MEYHKLFSEYQLLKAALAEIMLNEFCSRLIAGIAVLKLAEDMNFRPLLLLWVVQLVAPWRAHHSFREFLPGVSICEWHRNFKQRGVQGSSWGQMPQEKEKCRKEQSTM